MLTATELPRPVVWRLGPSLTPHTDEIARIAQSDESLASPRAMQLARDISRI